MGAQPPATINNKITSSRNDFLKNLKNEVNIFLLLLRNRLERNEGGVIKKDRHFPRNIVWIYWITQ